MAIQFHTFLSSFYAPGQKRWLTFAYGSLAVIIILIMLGHVTESITVIDNKLYPRYDYGIIFLLVSLLVLVGRNFYAFGKRLRILNNPVIYNQIICLTGTSIIYQTVKGTGIVEGKLILIVEDKSRIVIDGKNIHTIGHKERIQELILKAQKQGFDIHVKSIMHYANEREGNKKGNMY